MVSLFRKPAWVLASICILAVAAQAVAAQKTTKSIPSTITTQQGVTYNSVQLVSSNPEGIVINYKPDDGGVGMATLRFRNLPDSLRQEFNYDESAATQYASARQQSLAQWIEQRRNAESQQQQQLAEANGASENPQPNPFPVDRFRGSGTIRGAMILDTVTGEAWLLDQHSVLNDYQDRTYFLQPKLLLPQEAPKAVIIGP